MTRREKTLAGAVAVVVALWGLTVGLDRFRTALEQRRAQQRDVEQQLSSARLAAARGRFARRQLERWQRQSLPTNHDVALSAYQDWLREQLVAAGLKITELDDRESRRGRNPHYHQVSFDVEAEGQLPQLTDFLYLFYQSPHLHRISKANVAAEDEGQKLAISLTVDALSLAGCQRTEALAQGTSGLIPQPLDELQQTIVGRNMFVAHASPRTEDAPQETARARVTAMSRGQAGWQMSVLLTDSGKVLVFREGDAIQIGGLAGTVEKVDGRRAIVSTASSRLQILLGENLSDARPLVEPAS